MRTTICVTSGVGPHEVREFVRLLATRMELLCQRSGLVVAQSIHVGDEHAPRSVKLVVDGDARPLLLRETGTHCLVARSQQRGRKARKRWFAGVRVAEDEVRPGPEIELCESDLLMTACRASGPGGQHVNKTSSAVQVVHRPSGIAIKVMERRSQHANRKLAIERICQELIRRKETSMRKNQSKQRREHYRLERGSPVKEYRLGHDRQLELLHGNDQP